MRRRRPVRRRSCRRRATDPDASSMPESRQRSPEDIMTTDSAPDLVLTNAKITTLDPANPEATCVSVKDGRIVEVGDFDASEFSAAATHVIDVQGRRVV